MKRFLLLFCATLVLAGCSSTRSGPADYADADRDAPTPAPEPNNTSSSTQVVTPEPAPIPTKDQPEGSVLNHNSPDQPLYSP